MFASRTLDDCKPLYLSPYWPQPKTLASLTFDQTAYRSNGPFRVPRDDLFAKNTLIHDSV